MAPDGALAGRWAVITGASGGIGAACARALHREGARLVLLGRDMGRLEALGREFGEVACLAGDLARDDLRRGAQAGIRRIIGGAPDILVNNAAHFFLAPLERTTVDQMTLTFSVNLIAPFELIRAFLPDMRARGSGHIVNIGSVADHRAFRENAAYGASKHALRGLHEVLRTEVRGSGIRATLISPGHTNTPIWDAVDADTMQAIGPRHRMLPPSAVGDAVRYAVTSPAEVNVDEIRVSRA